MKILKHGTTIDLPADEKVNVLGVVIEEDLPLLQYVKKGGSRFSFHGYEML
ncbi:phospho-sugar glycosidase domain-containing protein [Bacillus massiliigorillae]|uniref:phospho-sugar glycosidase domain-containing protein n=1 Tax=Bacillus massiliigorillae TaxID=1243664 RepID=UPI0003A26F1F|nr:phospho-sugar glycosidase domain-containing protein [Bacillus massiliigorillae]